MPPSVLIIGGNSDIGRAVAELYASSGYNIQFSTRDNEKSTRESLNLKSKYKVDIEAFVFDILDVSKHLDFLTRLPRLPDIAVCAVGLLPDQRLCETDPAYADMAMRSNYNAPALLLELIAGAMEARGYGTIIGISSVAGDRGRSSNYTYGSAKAGFTTYLAGLRIRVAPRNIHVITVKPGFVRTRMTQHMKLPKWLTADPQEVAIALRKAEKRNQGEIYVRPIWRWIMLIIRCIPEGIFKRLPM